MTKSKKRYRSTPPMTDLVQLHLETSLCILSTAKSSYQQVSKSKSSNGITPTCDTPESLEPSTPYLKASTGKAFALKSRNTSKHATSVNATKLSANPNMASYHLYQHYVTRTPLRIYNLIVQDHGQFESKMDQWQRIVHTKSSSSP